MGYRRPGPRCRGGALEGCALSLSPWPRRGPTPLELNRPFSVGTWPTPPFFGVRPMLCGEATLSRPLTRQRGGERIFVSLVATLYSNPYSRAIDKTEIPRESSPYLAYCAHTKQPGHLAPCLSFDFRVRMCATARALICLPCETTLLPTKKEHNSTAK